MFKDNFTEICEFSVSHGDLKFTAEIKVGEEMTSLYVILDRREGDEFSDQYSEKPSIDFCILHWFKAIIISKQQHLNKIIH